MKQIKVNPNNEKYYSSEFIKGFNCGAQRQFEADMADRKAENSSEKPNNSTISKMEQVDEPTEITYQNCSDALLKMWMDNVLTDAEYNRIMDKLNTEIAKAIVHKMIDDAVLAEDAYPDLRQKMHDAVDEYEPQTERNE